MKKLLKEWKRFLKEVEEEAQVAAGGITADQLYQLQLPQFVKALQSNKKDIIQAVLGGLQDNHDADDKVNISSVTIQAAKLRPTQSEVVFSKSIPFALQRPKVFLEYLSGNGPFKVGPPGNDAIITLNGKYILDGHHRWSSLFCINPYAEMYAFNIQAPVSALNALKLMQASILKYAGSVPSNKGGGVNLFTIEEQALEAEIKRLVTPEIASALIQGGLIEKAEGRFGMREDIEPGRQERMSSEAVPVILDIYKTNVNLMQKKNRPVSGASNREPMPQTDKPAGSSVAAGGETPAALQPLEKGEVDFRSPFSHEK